MTAEDLALLVLRSTLGGIYVVHGLRKLGWRNTTAFDGFAASIRRRGFRPAVLWAAAAVVAEVVGGTLVIVGFLTAMAAALLVAQSVTIAAIAAPRGWWHDQGGVEYPLLLGVASLSVCVLGPGAISVDAALGLVADPLVGLALAGLGVVVALVGIASRRVPSS